MSGPLILKVGSAVLVGALIGLMVRGGQVTQLKLSMTGLELTVRQQTVGLEGLGRIVQSAGQRGVCP